MEHKIEKLETDKRLTVVSITCSCGTVCTTWPEYREHKEGTTE